jgi:tRNA nucleotidyltransferase (CCA-adding enzyme)
MHQKLSAEKAETILQRLRFDNATTSKIKKLILEHDRQIGDTEKSIRKAIAAIGVNLFEDWMQVRLADINAQNPDKAFERITALHAINTAYDKIIAENQCLSLKDLALTGKDLMDMGFPQGKDLGDTLKRLLDAVLEQPELNERNKLLELARKLM